MSFVEADFDEGAIQVATASQVAALNRSEIEAQLDAAHKYPRSIARFLKEAESMATISEDVAESCMYALPRGDGDPIPGPSVRLAEICASAYTNMQFGSRVLDVEETEIISQGVAWDMEKNIRVSLETRRRIIGKTGKRYKGDMINVTGAAASAIALRNAIFKVIPLAYVRTIYGKAKAVAVGDAKTLYARREGLLGWLQKAGAKLDRILARVGKPSVEDVGLDDLEKLYGLANAIKSSELTVDNAFPDPGKVDATTAGEGETLEEKMRRQAAKGAAKPEPKAEPKAEPAKEPAAASGSQNRPPSTPPPANDQVKPPTNGSAMGIAASAFADAVRAAQTVDAIGQLLKRIDAASKEGTITPAEHTVLHARAKAAHDEIAAAGA